MRFCIALLIAAAVSASPFLAKPTPEARHVLFTRHAAPSDWTQTEKAPAQAPIRAMIALKQRNLKELDRMFWAATDPQSPSWQDWKTPKEILDVIAPSQEDHDTVYAWLLDNGVKPNRIFDHRDALEITTTVAVAERLFSTTFYTFTHTETNKTKINALGEYSIPVSVSRLIDFVSGLSYFPIPHYNVHSKRNVNEAATPVSIPQTLFQVYSYPTETVGSENVVSQGVIEFEGQNFSPTDLSTWGTQVSIKVQPVGKGHVVGPNNPNSAQLEATLDIEMVASADSEVTNWFWLEPGNNWLYEFGVHFFGTSTVPLVISISYGWAEFDQCAINPNECSKIGVNSQGYVLRTNTEFQKIGLRGVSIVVASGDSGANGRTDYYCTESHLNPDYPACSPYVLSVGATQLTNPTFGPTNAPNLCKQPAWKCMSGGTEEAVSYQQAEFASGGGFSNFAAQPSWQSAAVSAYLKSGVTLPPSSYFNASGRAYPDVAAIGSDVLIYQKSEGGLIPVGGTSASSPTWASVVSLMVAAQWSKTSKGLGLLPPIIYAAAAADPSCFHDITIGNNVCTEQGCAKACKGYQCTTGWDPVSGWGSPNVNCLLSYITAQVDAKIKTK